MSSSAYPDIKLNYTSVFPCISEGVNDYLETFNRVHKLLLEALEKVGAIYNVAANDLLSLVETSNKKIVEVTKGATKLCSSSLVLFVNQCLIEVEKQASSLKNFQSSLRDSVVKPLRHDVRQTKEMWKTCFRYADSFAQQICKQETALQKCYKQYSEAAVRVNPENAMERPFQIFHDLHNTYVLQCTSVDSIHNVFCTDVLTHIMHCIEKNHDELNNNYRHHLNNMLDLQSNTWNEMVKSGDQKQGVLESLNILQDLQDFIKVSNEKMKDSYPSRIPSFSWPKVNQPKIDMLNNLDSTFIISETTRPNLQRRLALLQQQTQQLVHDISATRETEKPKRSQAKQLEDKAMSKLISTLNICEKEANLNVLLKQMELYNPTVINFLGPMPENLPLENKHKPTEESNVTMPFNGTRSHEFIEPRVMKPISCFYCEKLIAFIGRGYICKVCKMSVHKKCATSVKFCEPLLPLHKARSTPELKTGDLKADTIRTSFVSYLSSKESYDEFLNSSEYLYIPIIPESLRSPTPRSGQGSKVLPDILDFSSSPLYATASDCIYHVPVEVTKENNRYDSENSLYNEGELDEAAKTANVKHPISPPKSLAKPSVARRPIFSNSSGEIKPPVAAKPNYVKSPEGVLNSSNARTPSSDKPPTKTAKPLVKNTKLDLKTFEMLHSPPRRNICVTLYDFLGTDFTHLSFCAGEKLELLEKSSSQWWHGELNGNVGYFPSNHVLEMNKDEKLMRALYDFSKKSELEISMKKGDIILLIYKKNDWLMVKTKQGEGLVPASYVGCI